MRIGRVEVKASRWPWQGYGWFPHKNGNGPKAIFNANGARFGAGWNYKLGFSIGGSWLLIDLLFGTVRISVTEKVTVRRKEVPAIAERLKAQNPAWSNIRCLSEAKKLWHEGARK